MTQVSSTKKGKSFFTGAMGHNFRYNVKDNMKLMIVIFVLHFAAVPMLLITALADILANGTKAAIDEGFIAAAVIGTGLAAASGMICALSVFKYLYSKSAVDMRLSLPMTTTQRFVSDFLSGLFVYIVPYIAAELVSWILMLAGHILCDGKTFTFTTTEPNVPGGIKSFSWVCSIFEEAAPFLWRGMLGGLMLMVMFYAVTVLAAGCCGNIFESAAYDILLNILVPLSVYLAINSVSENVTGFMEEVYTQKIIPYCGPFGGAIGLVMSLETLNNKLDTYSSYAFQSETALVSDPLYFGVWLLLFTLCTLAVIAISYLIYRKRKAEDTGKPVVFGIFYHIIMTLGIFSLCYLMIVSGTTNFVPVIVITFIVYLVMHVIRNRGFGKIVPGLVIFAATIVVSIGSFLIIHDTKAFGAGEYVPAPEAVAKAQITYAGQFEKTTRYDYTPVSEITDTAAIKTLTEAHMQIVDYHNDENRYDVLYRGSLENTLIIKYTLRSGKTIIRCYYDVGTDAVNTLSALDTSGEVTKARAAEIKTCVTELIPLTLREYTESYDAMGNKNNLNDLYAELRPQWTYSRNGNDLYQYSRVGYSELPEDFLTKLGDCLESDILSESPAEYYTPSGRVWQLDIFGMGDIVVKDSYSDTMSYLSSCGFDSLPEPDKELIENIISDNDMNISMLSLPLIENMTEQDIPSATFYFFNDSHGRYFSETCLSLYSFADAYEYYDDLLTLFKHSYKEYKTDKSCYTIRVSGNSAVIPEEYSDVAERVFIRMTADKANYMAKRDFWEKPYRNDEKGGDYNGYSDYLSKFTEFYGKEKIVSALSYYYDSETAEETYHNLTEWSKVNTNFNEMNSEIYDNLAKEGYVVCTEAY